MAYCLRIAALAAISFTNLLAQSAAPQGASVAASDTAPARVITFDVVSIKLNKSGDPGNSGRSIDDGFIYTNWTLRNLIGGTYGNRDDLISGLPGWADSTHYDIQARVAPEDVDAYRKLRGAAGRRVYQQFLEDYFKVKVHIEVKEMPVYELVIAKGGPKFLPSDPGNANAPVLKLPDGTPLHGGGFMGRGQLAGSQMSISFLLSALQGASGRGVVDKTGLTGKYDFALKWKPDQGPGSDDTSADEPDIFTALEEQLGLKLVPATGPVKSLVVDHVEMPPEN